MRAYVVETTAPGTGAIAVVEVVGPDAREVFDHAFGPRALCGDSPLHTVIADREGELDDAVVALRSPERSMTGWPHVEIQCHGSPAIVKRVRRRLVTAGAIPAPWTFLLRTAVRNRRMTRLEEEAWIASMSAWTERAANELWEQRRNLPALAMRIGEARDRELLNQLIQTERYGSALARPHRVAILGRPNAGKSTLVNALAGVERVLVDPRPGTTRDVVEVRVAIQGIPFLLLDTAGVRDPEDDAERRGIQAALAAAGRASFRVYLIDPGDPVAGCLDGPGLHTWTKADLYPDRVRNRGFHSISAVTGEGMGPWKDALLHLAGVQRRHVVEGAFLFTRRQTKRAVELRDCPETEWRERWERWVWGRPGSPDERARERT